MTIAINSNQFTKAAGNVFFYEHLESIAVSQPAHQFIFITASANEKQLIASNNIIYVISSPGTNNVLTWKIWLDFTLPAITRKYKADLLINTGGACSLRARLPQYLFISDLSFLNFPGFLSNKQRLFLKRYMPAFLGKATRIITASDFLTEEIIQQYFIDKEKINRFQPMAAEHYRPAGWKEKETIKEKYAAGKEYFLFSGEIHPRNNLMNLLKAFSFFKTRQKSNMQLIITAKTVSAGNAILENFKTYKYRQEVNILLDLPEKDLAAITAGAYAFLYPAMYEGMALFPIRAMQCEVPVITTKTGALTETGADAFLYADPANFEDIADKMMQLFKDETKRSELIKRGKLILANINNEKINEFWEQSFLIPGG